MNKKRVKKSKKQKIYNMKGCSKRYNSKKQLMKQKTRKSSIGGDQPIAPLSFQQGGIYGSSNSALIGEPWSVLTSGNENYLAENLYKSADPQTMMQIRGGKKQRRKKNKTIKGGGLIPSDLVNFGRDISYNVNTAYNALNGYKAPPNPSPYEGQLTKSISESRIII